MVSQLLRFVKLYFCTSFQICSDFSKNAIFEKQPTLTTCSSVQIKVTAKRSTDDRIYASLAIYPRVNDSNWSKKTEVIVGETQQKIKKNPSTFRWVSDIQNVRIFYSNLNHRIFIHRYIEKKCMFLPHLVDVGTAID